MMKKKMITLLSTLAVLCVGVAAGCNPPTPNDVDPTAKITYEGDMLYNGFDSVEDMYRVNQLYVWNYSPIGKLQIVDRDNFIPEDGEQGQSSADAVVALIDALPNIGEITIEDKNAIANARRAYGALNDEEKALVGNIGELEAAEACEALKGYYSLNDLGGDFASDITNAQEWQFLTGQLANSTSGTVVFNVKGIKELQDGAFYISLFNDSSISPGQSNDGISIWVRTHNDTLLLQNAGEQEIRFNREMKISESSTYTFYVGYEVDEAYEALTVFVKIAAENGAVIAEGMKTVTDFTSANFGTQTVKSWLKEHENAANHQTFAINTGFSSSVTVQNAWVRTEASDYLKPGEQEKPRNEEDLSPRQGDGALRVSYVRGTFSHILARFDRSLLSGLPIDNIASFSVKIYNDSAEEKTVRLSLMKEQNANIDLENGVFALKPYAWTECKVTLDPVVMEYLKDELIGLNVKFDDVTDSVYYLDDMRVQFGKIYTDEIEALVAKADALKADIAKLSGRSITLEDKHLLEDLYNRFNELPQMYQYTVDNVTLLNEAVDAYFLAVNAQEKQTDSVTLLHTDTVFGLSQVTASAGVVSYSAEDGVDAESGATVVTFDGNSSFSTIDVSVLGVDAYDELHIWLKNDSAYKRAFYINWKVSDWVESDSLAINSLDGGYVLPANSGWIKLVYTKQFTPTQFNVSSLSASNAAINSVGSLLIGKMSAISNAGRVKEQIASLDEYAAGYSAEQKAKVSQARAAFNQLCDLSRNKVDNIDRLIGLEAAIWKEGFAVLPAQPADITSYNDAYKQAVLLLRESYATLDYTVKQAVADDEAKLSQYEERLAVYRIEYVNGLFANLALKDEYTVADIKTIKTAKEQYELLSETDKASLSKESLEQLNACLEAISNYYTLSDLGGGFANDIFDAQSWSPYSGKLPDAKSGTVVFNVSGLAENMDGAFYVSLFHDPSKDAGQANDGIDIWLRTHNSTVLFQNSGEFAINLQKAISKDETYTYYVGYTVAEDLSNVTISVKITDASGETVASGTNVVTSFKTADFGSQTVQAWLKAASADARQNFFITTGNSQNIDITDAW